MEPSAWMVCRLPGLEGAVPPEIKSMRGFAPARRDCRLTRPERRNCLIRLEERDRCVVEAKGPKTIAATSWSFGFSARLASSGGCATRFAQTVLAVFPDSAALLGHAEGRRSDKVLLR